MQGAPNQGLGSGSGSGRVGGGSEVAEGWGVGQGDRSGLGLPGLSLGVGSALGGGDEPSTGGHVSSTTGVQISVGANAPPHVRPNGKNPLP
jgi:hypothetical protein